MPTHKMTHIKDGFTPAKEADYDYLLTNGRFCDHKDVTDNIAFQQIVPCIWIVGSSSQNFVRRVSNYRRSFNLPLLLQKTHVMNTDRYVNPIKQSIQRLLTEELDTAKPYHLQFIGYVRDSQLRKDHIGLVYKLKCKTKKSVKVRKPERTGANWKWKDNEALINDYYHYKDPWDSIIINEIFKESRE